MRKFIKALLVFLTCSPISAQTTITVGNGETLTDQDLENGSFGGQPFLLSDETIIEVRAGGAIATLGQAGRSFRDPVTNRIITIPTRYANFMGATVKLLDDSTISGGFAENLNIVFEGGDQSGSTSLMVQGDSHVTLSSEFGFGSLRILEDVVVDVFTSFSPEGVIQVDRATELNLFVSEFEVGGIGTPLIPGENFSEISQDNTSYKATFPDGSVWSFVTQSVFPTGRRDRIPDGIRIAGQRVSGIVPEPTTGILAFSAILLALTRRCRESRLSMPL